MGRGRAKAKQRKVARELKYRTYDADFEALQRELAGRADGKNGDSYGEQDDPDEYDYDDGSGADDRIAR
ncbi:MAG TPA: DUF3073 family protein [Actinopolymorphaceae bacterium]|jgi:hypothetical protein